MANNKFTAEDYKNMINRYQSGESSRAIGASYDVVSGTISRILRRHGVALRPRPSSKFTIEQERKIAALYKSGMRSSEIAARFGCHLVTVRNIARSHDATVRPRGAVTRVFSAQEIAGMVRLYQSGKSQESIAKTYSCSQAHVSRLLRGAGVPTARDGRRHPKWKGGRVATSDGYILVWVAPDDKFAAMRGLTGYVLEHRLMMARHLGRPLLRHETVHHINGDRTDSRIKNLQLRQGKHGNGVVMRCLSCGSHNVEAVRLD